MDTSIEDLRALVSQSILSTEAFENQLAASQEQPDKRAAEADKTIEALNQQIKKLGKQIGGLGKKFGSFTEGCLRLKLLYAKNSALPILLNPPRGFKAAAEIV